MFTRQRLGRAPRFSVRATIPFLLALAALGVFTILPALRTERRPGFTEALPAYALEPEQNLNGLIPGVDYMTDTLQLLFTDASGVTTPSAVQAALAAIAETDSVVAATTFSEIVNVFNTSAGVSNRDYKLSIGMDRIFRLHVAGTDIVDLITALSDEDDVERAEAQMIPRPMTAPNDPYYPTNQTTYMNPMQVEQAWNVTTGDPNVVIAFYDGDFEIQHEDLGPNMWENTGDGTTTWGEDFDRDGHTMEFFNGAWRYDQEDVNYLDDDGNGFKDDFVGWKFGLSPALGSNVLWGTDTHGTGVSGVAASRANNTLGVAGTCWSCRIMALHGNYADLAVIYATDMGADVINFSKLSGVNTATHLAIMDAVNQGVSVVAGAGNVGQSGLDPGEMFTPAIWDEVIGVSGTWPNDQRAGGNNGNTGGAYHTKVGVAAPWSGYTTTNNNGYTDSGGTSISSPYVAGIVGLMKAENPNLRRRLPNGAPNPDASMIAWKIMSGISGAVDPIFIAEGETPRYIGTGRVNAFKAVSYTDYPISLLDSFLDDQPINRRSLLRITGTATSTNFQWYKVEFAEGTYPSAGSWVLINQSTTPVSDGLLAELYGSTFETRPDGVYTIRLTVSSTNGDVTFDETRITVSNQQFLFNPSTLTSAPVSADLDANFDLETLAATTDEKVYAWHHDGSIVDGWPVSKPGITTTTEITVMQLDSDLSQEVVVGSNTNLYAWNSDGTPVTGWVTGVSIGGNPGRNVAAADVNGDGAAELFVAAKNGTTGRVWGFRADGSTLPGWPVTVPFFPSGGVALGDVTGDGQLDVVTIASKQVYVWKADGTIVPNWPVTLGTNGSSLEPTLADVDSDDAMEIIIGYNSTTDSLRVLNGDASTLPGWPIALASRPSTAPVVGDIDHNGTPEIVMGLLEQATVGVWNMDGTPLASWQMPTLAGYPSASLGLADVNNNNTLEVVLGTRDSNRSVYILGSTGTPLANWNGVPTYQTTYPESIRGPMIDDIDNDGMLDLLVGANNLVYVWDLDSPKNFYLQSWLTAFGHVRRTGQLGPHCGLTQQHQCAPNKPEYCVGPSVTPRCDLCSCVSGSTCLPSGYCTIEGGGSCRPSCEL